MALAEKNTFRVSQMENEKDIRWKQRFENFNGAFKLLEDTVAISSPSVAERGGLIQFFEVTFELAWKLMKDYLESEGFEVRSPRETIKTAFQAGLIKDGHLWMAALEDRNLTTHTYQEEKAIAIETKIKNDYYQILKELKDLIASKL